MSLSHVDDVWKCRCGPAARRVRRALTTVPMMMCVRKSTRAPDTLVSVRMHRSLVARVVYFAVVEGRGLGGALTLFLFLSSFHF